MKRILLLSAIAVLTACSATPEECDPSVEMSLIQKMACSNSGSYDKRVSDKEAALANEQTRNQHLQTANQKAQATNAKLAKQVGQKQAQLNQLNRSLNQTTQQIKQKAQGNQQQLNEIKAIEQQIQQVNGSGASDAAKEAELKKLRSKLATYQKALAL